MDTLTCRLLPYAVADGPSNMAADEVLLQTAADGIASLRFYGWSEPTLSLGYFQPSAVRLTDSRLSSLPWVRRPTGGAALVHDQELTYALALPGNSLWHRPGSWMARTHGIIKRALEGLVAGPISSATGDAQRHPEFLCFRQVTAGDLLCAGAKVVGSAQRKHHQCLLQHGAILLGRSEHAPQLPGIRELTNREIEAETLMSSILTAFEQETGCSFEPVSWSEAERRATDALKAAKYSGSAWNEKR